MTRGINNQFFRDNMLSNFPIIKSLLETDLYKLTMMQAVFHHCPNITTEYAFKCRNKDIDFRPSFGNIQHQIEQLFKLRFSAHNLKYLDSLGLFKPDFLEFLKRFKLNEKNIDISCDDKTGELNIVPHGKFLDASPFEIYVLAVVNECYFANKVGLGDLDGSNDLLTEKIELIKAVNGKELFPAINSGFKFSDFGLRRRFSGSWHSFVVTRLAQELPHNFVGTSNVLLSAGIGKAPIGTMAHEWLQIFQAIAPLQEFQKVALQTWANEYRGKLGIALSDIVGMDAFLRDFDSYFSRLYDGCRHDSGDPFVWCEKLIQHYELLGINPNTKTAVFSDGLDIPKAIEIYKAFKDRINVVFGIGTNLTNDIPGVDPLQIVIKMTSCNGLPVAKLSDSDGKAMCRDMDYMKYLAKIFKKELIV